jgi:hypothetical protein
MIVPDARCCVLTCCDPGACDDADAMHLTYTPQHRNLRHRPSAY